MTSPSALLSGVRILDLSNVLAGPYCAYQLAMLGADVVKVETPKGGDLARQLGADAELCESHMGASFLAQNAGKRSLTLNLKSDKGVAVLKRLVSEADGLVENFRPGVMDRLGVGWSTLKTVNPGLVYCAVSGFGQDGPMRAAPAYDQIVQGLSGLMSVTGGTDTAPLRVGYPVADTLGGMTAAFALTAGLVARGRTGEGCFIDVSMLEAAISSMGWVVSNYLIAGQTPVPMGNDNFTAAPSGAFRTADGLLNIAANKQEQFVAVVQAIGKPHLADDPRFAKRDARKQNRAALTAEIEAVLITRPRLAWEEILNRVGVPAGRVLTVPEALDLDQIKARDLLRPSHAEHRDIQVVAAAFKVDGERPAAELAPPTLGQHTDDILGELGFTGAEIESLRAEAVI
jgi:crotonobetainyl-CoA:carnitine CoA-transferase CaiB-like acyl-CoA transferase